MDFGEDADSFLLDPTFLSSLSDSLDVDSVLAHFRDEACEVQPSGQPDTVQGNQKWTLGPLIAESGKCSVHQARGEDGTTAAVKILPLAHSENEHVDDEAQIARLLSNHSNIIQVVDYVKTRDSAYIFMERAATDLFTQIENSESGLDEDTARKWFRSLVEAVAHCHENNVVHRDIKPENCLITSGGALKLSDFGSAIRTTAAVDPTHSCGTVQYAAPERFSELVGTPSPVPATAGAPNAKAEKIMAAADLWSLGIVLYVLVKREFPFAEPSHGCAAFRRFIDGRDTSMFDGKISVELQELIRTLLKIIPADRPDIESLRRHPWLNPPVGLIHEPQDCAQEKARVNAICYPMSRDQLLHSTRTLSVH